MLIIDHHTHYYTPEQLADLLQISRRTVYLWVRERKLKAIKAGNRVRIPADAISKFLEPTT